MFLLNETLPGVIETTGFLLILGEIEHWGKGPLLIAAQMEAAGSEDPIVELNAMADLECNSLTNFEREADDSNNSCTCWDSPENVETIFPAESGC